MGPFFFSKMSCPAFSAVFLCRLAPPTIWTNLCQLHNFLPCISIEANRIGIEYLFYFYFFIFFSFLFFNHFSNRPTTFVSFRYFNSSNFFSSSSFHIFFFSIHCDYAGKLKFILAWLVCAFIMSHQPFANTHFRFSSTIQTTSLHVSPSPLNSPVSNAVDTVLSENNPCASDGDAFQIIILVCFPCWHFFMCLFSAFVLTETASIKQLFLSPTWVETRLNLFTNLL